MSNPDRGSLARRVAAVTGGGRGIGLGISTRLAQQGFDLAICGLRAEDAVAETLADLRRTGADVVYVRADVGDAADRAAFVEAIAERFGCLNVLVNNAGIAPRQRADLLEATEASFDEVMRTNLRGPYFLTQLVARWMVQQAKGAPDYNGCIVNVTSFSATVASTNRGDYCLSKAALAMASQLWAVRLAEFDIPVYEVRPGVIRTDMTAAVQARYDAVIAAGAFPQARWGTPDDVGKAVAALARGDLAYSTGQVLVVDGGFTLQRL